jgi:putative ABC transport system substrate-binding protein
MKRREFIAGLGSAVAWPLVARAQQPALPVIGYLSANIERASARTTVAFRQGLRELGFVEGQNVEIVYRWAEAQYDRTPELVAAWCSVGWPWLLPLVGLSPQWL